MAKMATREAYGKTLAKLAAENKKIIVLDADLSGSTKTAEVKKVCPNQHFNMGIAEGNMMSVAAGLRQVEILCLPAALRFLRVDVPMNKSVIPSDIRI